ncbi:MAG: amidohydrolase family protein, partial [Armatimonadota bacterium]
VTPGALELAAEVLGPDRLVLGTGAPESTGRPAINVILEAELPDNEKAAILGGNIAQLIAPQLAKLGRTLPESDMSAYERQRIRGPIVDVHGHLGPWPFPMRGWSAADLVKLMKRRGIEKAIVSSTKAIVNDFVEGNAELARDIEPHPELLGYVTINPNYPEQSVRELDRYLKLPQFVGVKFHCGYAGVSIDSEPLRRLLPRIAEKNVPILVHCWGHGEPTKVRRIAQEFPQISFVMGHGGVTAWVEAIDVLRATSNVYTEFSSSRADRGRVRATIDEVGCGRILFGSDLGLFDPAYDLGVYEEADLTAPGDHVR